jgi:hypothetical protein
VRSGWQWRGAISIHRARVERGAGADVNGHPNCLTQRAVTGVQTSGRSPNATHAPAAAAAHTHTAAKKEKSSHQRASQPAVALSLRIATTLTLIN